MIILEAVGDDPSTTYSLFTEPDFYYRTFIPDLLSDNEIRALVGARTLLCRRDGVPAGLIGLPAPDSDYPAHFLLQARFARNCPLPEAVAAVEDALRALITFRPVHRISHEVCDSDRRGVELAEAVGLDLEGTVPGVLALAGGRHGIRYYAKVFEEPDA